MTTLPTINEPATPVTPPVLAPVKTKDKWEIIALITFGFPPTEVRPMPGSSQASLFAFAPTATTVWEQYRRGEVMPVPDIRLVKRAEEIFKAYIRS
jgi:hypothetical protein